MYYHFLQPQLVVLPLFKLLEVEICSPPQSHLQRHLCWPLSVDGNCSTTINFPNRSPIRDGCSLISLSVLYKKSVPTDKCRNGVSITVTRHRLFFGFLSASLYGKQNLFGCQSVFSYRCFTLLLCTCCADLTKTDFIIFSPINRHRNWHTGQCTAYNATLKFFCFRGVIHAVSLLFRTLIGCTPPPRKIGRFW